MTETLNPSLQSPTHSQLVSPAGSTARAAAETMQQADGHFGRGEWQAARVNCVRVLATHPDHVGALCMLGVLAAQAGQPEPAAELFRRLIEVTPSDPIAHNNYANVLLALGRTADALESYGRALSLDPNFAEAYVSRGAALIKLKRYDEAVQNCDRATQLKPDFAQAYYNRGNALTDLGLPHEALLSYEQSLRLQARNPEAWFGRGVALERLRRPAEAIASYEQALKIRPQYAEAWYGRGNVLKDLGRPTEALQSYSQALRAKPGYTEALNNQGQVLRQLNRWPEALQSFNSALALDADYPWLRGTWLHTRMQLGDWQNLSADIDTALRDAALGKNVVPPFAMLALTDSLKFQLLAATKLCVERTHDIEPLPATTGANTIPGVTHRRIRVAYLSADFCDHPVSYLMAGVFEHHDRDRFEILAASLRPASEDVYGRRVSRAVDRFADLSQMTDMAAAQQLRALGTDILIDLTGHTRGARLNILAYRPAPVQVNYLGFPGTSGSVHVDYLIADRHLIPSAFRDGYSEQIVYLPDCFQANDDARPYPSDCPSRSHLGLPDDALVLCCFNNNYKLTPPLFDLWMRLLHAFPNSVLWLAASDTPLRQNLRHEAAHRGVSSQRLVFAERLPYEQHLARLPRADLFLDTLPFNGGTTVSDALWMGVPVLSCEGEAMASRMGGALLRALDLPELACANLPQYEHTASTLLADPERLAQLRQKLIRRRSTAPLFETARFTRHFENALEHMHRRHCAGEGPQHFEIDPS